MTSAHRPGVNSLSLRSGQARRWGCDRVKEIAPGRVPLMVYDRVRAWDQSSELVEYLFKLSLQGSVTRRNLIFKILQIGDVHPFTGLVDDCVKSFVDAF